MDEKLYLVELPGKASDKLVVAADTVSLQDGCACFWRTGTTPGIGLQINTLIATFAPGRWVSVKLGVPRAKEESSV